MSLGSVRLLAFCLSGLAFLESTLSDSVELTINNEKKSFSARRTLGLAVDVYYNVVDDQIEIAVRSRHNGWLGFGFSESGIMVPSNAVVGWSSESDYTNAYIGDYRLTDHAQSGVTEQGNQKLSDSIIEAVDGIVTSYFKRALIVEGVDPPIGVDSPTDIIYAKGELPVGVNIPDGHGHNKVPQQFTFQSNPVPEVLLDVTVQGETKTFQGHVSMSIGFDMYWSITGDIAEIAVTTAHDGWVGFGFSDSADMIDSNAVVGWTSGDEENTFVGDYFLGDIFPENVTIQGNQQLQDQSIESMDGILTLYFKRPLHVDDVVPDLATDSTTFVIFARGPLPASPDSPLTSHNETNRGKSTVVFNVDGIFPHETAAPENPAKCDYVFGGDKISFENCRTLQEGFTIYWKIETDEIEVVVSCEHQGWIGFGFSPEARMKGSNAVIGWSLGDDTHIGDYYLGAYFDTEVVELNQQELIIKEISRDEGFLALHFRRKLELAGIAPMISTKRFTNIVFAKGDIPESPNSLVVYHSIHRVAEAFDFAHGGIADAPTDPWRTTHAVVMSLSWGIMVPLGITSARFFKRYKPTWFHIHRGVNATALLMALFGFLVGLFKIGSHDQYLHLGLAITITFFGLQQPYNAWFRPKGSKKGQDPSPQRIKWQQHHWWLGRATLALAIFNIGVGQSVLELTTPYVVVFWTAFGFITAFYLYEEYKKRAAVADLRRSSRMVSSGMEYKILNDENVLTTIN